MEEINKESLAGGTVMPQQPMTKMTQEEIDLDIEKRRQDCVNEVLDVLKSHEFDIVAEDRIGMSTVIRIAPAFFNLKRYPTPTPKQDGVGKALDVSEIQEK